MAPFRKRPVKWDGTKDSQYINKEGYKYDVVNQTIVESVENMPKCLLAETSEEAENVYESFKKDLNNLSYLYAVSTKLSKADLFGDALIGLARACRDWDPGRSKNFRSYAIFRIKDALNEFARTNSASISVPAYIKKARYNLDQIMSICKDNDVDYRTVVEDQELSDKFSMRDAVRCTQLVENLINAATRAKVEYHKFIERISYIPEDVEYKDQVSAEIHSRNTEMLEAALTVEKIKEYMDEDELAICEGIMLDKSMEEIGKSMDRSKGWVSTKLKALRDRLITLT